MAPYALKGQKLLAQGVWGKQGESSELFFVPQISQIYTDTIKKGLYATMNGWRIDPFFVVSGIPMDGAMWSDGALHG